MLGDVAEGNDIKESINKNLKKQAKSVASSVTRIGKRELKRRLSDIQQAQKNGDKRRKKGTIFDV